MLAAPLDGIILLQAGYFFTNYQRLFQSLEAVNNTHVPALLQRQAQYESFSKSTGSNDVRYRTDCSIDTTGRINNSGGLGAFHIDGVVLV